MPFTARDVLRNLKRKGFVEDQSKHHTYLRHYRDGRATGPYTYVSFGARNDDLGPNIVRSMKQQLSLETNAQVNNLVECPMTGEDYTELLIRLRIIDP